MIWKARYRFIWGGIGLENARSTIPRRAKALSVRQKNNQVHRGIGYLCTLAMTPENRNGALETIKQLAVCVLVGLHCKPWPLPSTQEPQ